MILRRCFAFVVVLVGINTTALAETWPTRPIKAFIPFSAGSATDVIPRVVFEELSTQLGQPIVVENRGGAGGTIGVGAVVAAAPDGYTILANSSAHTIAPWIVPNLPYNVATDLRATVALGKNANMLVVSPSKGWRTLQDLVAAAKAKPGTFNYGSAGVGTATHISAERLRLSAKFEATHIPYKGGPEALADVLAGRIDFYYCPISTRSRLCATGASWRSQSAHRPARTLWRRFQHRSKPATPIPTTRFGTACSCQPKPRRQSLTRSTPRPRRCSNRQWPARSLRSSRSTQCP